MGTVNSKQECLEHRLWDIELRYASHRNSVHEVGHCKTDVRSVITRLRYTTLLEACALPDKERSLLTVRYLLRQGEDPNGNSAVTTPLINAVCQNNVRVVRELCAHGANVNKRTTSTLTPLSVATKYVKNKHLIYDHGGDQMSVIMSGAGPAFAAAEEIIHELYAHGADLKTIDEHENTHWFIPTAGIHVRLPCTANNSGETPLLSAAKRGQLTAVQFLCRLGADVNKQDKQGNTALICAASFGHVSVIRELCTNGADVNQCNDSGESPLFHAVQKGHSKAVRVLCEFGADTNKTYEDGNTVLFTAVKFGYTEIVHKLCEHGAGVNINQCNDSGESPLFHAVKKDHSKFVRVLCELGADINKTYEHGNTVLFTAVKFGYTEIVHKLREHGADVNTMNMLGQTPLRRAVVFNHRDIVRILCTYGANVNQRYFKKGNTLLFAAVTRRYTAVIQELCENGADVNKCNYLKQTPLHCATQQGHLDTVRTLTKCGADVNKADGQGNTALFIAASSGHEAIIYELCRGGADINKANHQGETPLYPAVTKGRVKTVEILCELGVDVNTNRAEMTPLTLAAKLLIMRTHGWLFSGTSFSLERMTILHLLLKAGSSPSSSAFHTKSPLTYALEAEEGCYLTADKRHLYCECLMLMLLAGYQVTPYDYQLMNSDDLCSLLATEGVLQYAHDMMCAQPPLLQELCKISLRRSVLNPIGKYIPKTGLPGRLQKYVLLERPNKTGDQRVRFSDYDWNTMPKLIRHALSLHTIPLAHAADRLPRNRFSPDLWRLVTENNVPKVLRRRTENDVPKLSHSKTRNETNTVRKIHLKVPMYRSRKGHGRKNNVC